MRLVGALLLVASAAAAQPEVPDIPSANSDPDFSFEWNAPPPCPDRAEVLARAERLIGRTLPRAVGGQPVGLVAAVQALPNATWQLRVLSGPGGESERSVSASSCEELGDAMALLIALSIDPDYLAREGSTPSVEGRKAFADAPKLPPAGLQSAGTPTRKAITQPALVSESSGVRARSTPRLQVAVGALGAVCLGRLPKAAPGGLLFGTFFAQELVFGLGLSAFPMQHIVEQSAGADLSLATLEGSIGYALLNGLLTPSVGLEFDRLHGVGSAIKEPRSGTIWLLGFDAGLELRYPMAEPLGLLVTGRVSVLPEQARFHIDPNMELFRLQRVGAQFGLGAELRIR